ncbi:MAG: carbon-nitrogen hydrolase family protein [Chloroflexi bacterium]|nr:carbon-nitrogen hydrolase family protein [Chloroflexota bacterium]
MQIGRTGMAPVLTVATTSAASKLFDTQANLDKAAGLIQKASQMGAEIVVFPELYLQGYCAGETQGKFFELAEPVPGPSTDFLVKQAKEHNIYVVMGMAEASREYRGYIHNSAVFLGTEGILSVHRKVHLAELPSFPKEIHYGFAPGDDFRVFTIKQDWNIGLSICRDTFFPEAVRVMALKGMDVLITLSAATLGACARWLMLNPARAIENDIFNVYSNVVGNQNGTEFCGGAHVVSPSGAFLVKGKTNEEEVLVARLEAKELLDCRKGHQYLRDRRPSAYKELLSTEYPHM